VELSGAWRACIADDDARREGVGLDYDDSSWPNIAVPGHWRHSPDFADSDGPLIYRHRFHLDAPEPGRRTFVRLDGIFYQADVWLDGAYLGDPEGYFFTHSFDITDLARLADDHVLAIELACSPQRGAKRNITGVLQHSDTIPASWNPGGLWRGVHLDTTGAVRIDRLRVVCRDANDARAHLRLHARLDSDRPRTALVRTSVAGKVAAEHSQSLAAGLNEVTWNLDVNDPELWWPWSLGPQHLTDVRVEVLIDGDLSDERRRRTGLREVALQDWTFSVNGERLFAKGVNLPPTTAALADATPAQVRRDVELARDAGLDLLRVNGHIARPELYDAADELGMLVWQDFPLQGSYARTIRKEAVRQAREAVDLLGHHPSVAVWCAHNDPQPASEPRAAVAGAGASIVRNVLQQQRPTWNKSILDRWVKRAFETADESRSVVAHSGVAPHVPQLDGTDSHLFFGWYHGETADLDGFAAAVPRMVRFVSEFGAQSVPGQADFVEPDRWPALDWQRLADDHGLQLGPFEHHVPPAEHATFASWRDATQRYQADLLRHSIETLRRLKYHPTGGFCFLNLFDPVPAVSWGILDHDRHPKLAYHAVTEACHPVIVVADHLPANVVSGEAIALDVHVVSDLRVLLEDVHCTATLRWPGGNHQWSWRGDVPPDAVVRVGTAQFVVPDVAGGLWFDLTLEHTGAAATNRYTAIVDRPATGRVSTPPL
jgi:beta-mannosidase